MNTGLIVLFVYLAGAVVTAVICSVIDRLDRRADPKTEPAGEEIALLTIIWPLVSSFLLIRTVYRRVLSPALESITDAVEAPLNERNNRKDDSGDRRE